MGKFFSKTSSAVSGDTAYKRTHLAIFLWLFSCLPYFPVSAQESSQTLPSTAKRLFEEGVAAFKVGDYEKAMDLFLNATFEDPSYEEARTRLEQTLKKIEEEKARKVEEERKRLMEALEKKPPPSVESEEKRRRKEQLRQEALRKKTEEEARRKAEEAARRKAEAEALRKKAEEEAREQSAAKSLILRAEGLMEDGHLGLSQESLQGALALSPQEPSVKKMAEQLDRKMKVYLDFISKGAKSMEEGHYIRSADYYEQALEVYKEAPQAQQGLEQVNQKMKNYLIGGKFKDMRTKFYFEGFFFYTQKQYAEALSSWEKARALESGGSRFDLANREIPYYMEKARAFMKRGNVSARITALLSEADSHLSAGRYAEAVRALSDAYRLDSSNTTVAQRLEKARGLLAQMRPATKTKPQKAQPQPPPLDKNSEAALQTYTEAVSLYAAGQLEKAISTMEKALRLDPELVKASVALQRMRAQLKR